MPVILERQPSSLAPEITPLVQGTKHFCFDIETCHASKKDVELVMRFWKPPANLKDEAKIEQKEKEAHIKATLKSALLDAAPIGSVAFRTEKEATIFCSVKPKKKFIAIKNIPAVIGLHDTERSMLISMRRWLDERITTKSILIGFNIIKFDLPKLRFAYLRHRLRLPVILQPEARDAGIEVYDVMAKYLRHYTTEKSNDRWITLAEVTARLGLPEYKGAMSGAEVPDFFKKGKVKEVLTYNYLDTGNTYSSFLMMTGQYEDQVKA